MPALNQLSMTVAAKTRFQSATAQFATSRRAARDDVAAFIEPMCKAIGSGHDQWRAAAFFRDIRINAVIATGGTLVGPALEPLIKQRAPTTGAQGWAQRYSAAIAAALGEAWGEYQRSFSVPGLPWYPTFAAFPGPFAPPTPNVPTPLMACVNDRTRIAAISLKDRMTRKLGAAGPFSAQLFDAIAAAFESAVTAWLAVQLVANVLGKGQVPTYAPPYVPVGPVVMGQTLPVPGHLP